MNGSSAPIRPGSASSASAGIDVVEVQHHPVRVLDGEQRVFDGLGGSRGDARVLGRRPHAHGRRPAIAGQGDGREQAQHRSSRPHSGAIAATPARRRPQCDALRGSADQLIEALLALVAVSAASRTLRPVSACSRRMRRSGCRQLAGGLLRPLDEADGAASRMPRGSLHRAIPVDL